jgi:murein DD-endopeptidase MepM/ murein hydrolase activator NlpD
VAVTSIFSNMVLNNALLADFPQVDPLATGVPGTQGKISKYVTIEKRVFITGCPENKCKNPAFPIRAEYAITIRPKENYTIAITQATDTLRVSHSSDSWEEHEGRTPPDIPERVKGLDDFPDLYEELTIGPGEELSFSYTESFNENYNHSIIINNFELAFFYNDPEAGEEGTDNAITGEVIYVGDYSQGAGCWPTSGRVSQLPAGGFTHSNADAFDIANVEGTPIYTPFAGQACTSVLSTEIYGNHVVVTATTGQRFSFAHMRNQPFNGCRAVEAGEVIGFMGTTGNSTGNHLHFGLIGGSPRPSTLATLMPNGTAIKKDDHVRSCYGE